jgi:hypothetical protein
MAYARRRFAENKRFLTPTGAVNILDNYRAVFRLSFLDEPGVPFELCKKVANRATKGERYARQACIEAAARFITDGRVLPPPLAVFISSHLLSGAQAGGKRGRDPRVNLMRDIIIANVIINLREDFGISPTRNPDRSEKTHSGCSIVTGLLQEIGLRISEDAVERIWKRCKENGPEIQI